MAHRLDRNSTIDDWISINAHKWTNWYLIRYQKRFLKFWNRFYARQCALLYLTHWTQGGFTVDVVPSEVRTESNLETRLDRPVPWRQTIRLGSRPVGIRRYRNCIGRVLRTPHEVLDSATATIWDTSLSGSPVSIHPRIITKLIVAGASLRSCNTKHKQAYTFNIASNTAWTVLKDVSLGYTKLVTIVPLGCEITHANFGGDRTTFVNVMAKK